MSFDTGDNFALDGDLLKDTADLLESHGYRRGNYRRDTKGVYAWTFADRGNPYLTFTLTARASPPWHKTGYGQIISVHNTLVRGLLSHPVVVVALRRKPDDPTEFHVFDRDEILER